MISKQERINELLKSNRTALLNNENQNAICYDGIVNEAMYEHVVVLLKETNGTDATGKIPEKLEDWNYCRWLKEQQVENIPEKKINRYGEIYEEKTYFIIQHSESFVIGCRSCLIVSKTKKSMLKNSRKTDR